MGIVHITGGGFIDNIPRVLPKGCKAIINQGSWPRMPIFEFLKKKGNVSSYEMHRTFNCGIGMAVVVTSKEVDDVLMQLQALGETAQLIGEVAVRGPEDEEGVELR